MMKKIQKLGILLNSHKTIKIKLKMSKKNEKYQKINF